jgi:GT2 family glycosyltransferase
VTITTPILVTVWQRWLDVPTGASATEQDYYPMIARKPTDCGYGLGVFPAPQDSSATVSVSIVVVTHNNSDLIGPCLRAIFDSVRAHTAEVIVVDSASTDRTVRVITDEKWPVEMIKLKDNIGFARAVNCAWACARGRYVALINSDAFPDPGCIDKLVCALERKPSIGIVGGKLRYPSGLPQPSAGTFPSLLGGLWVALFLHRVPGLSRLGIGYLADERLYRHPRRVDWVSAAVCASRGDVGPLPTSSFMYGEDVEWAFACRDAGLEVWLEPEATAVHIGRASVDQSQEMGFAQRRRAQFELAWFARRRPLVRLGARLVLLVHSLLRLLVFGALAVLRGRRDRRVVEYAALFRAALSARQAAS